MLVSGALDPLTSGARSSLGRALTEPELEAFDKYLKLLQQWQRSQRLIGSTEPRWIVENLFLDSLLFLHLVPDDVRSVADLGSGAGVPGIPIKIVRPWLAVTLIESRERRASFLSAVVRELGLGGVRVVNTRAEQVAIEFPRAFDAVVMRCAGDLSDVMPVAASLAIPGGIVIAAGPPTRRPLSMGAWRDVPGTRPGTTRRFAVHRTSL
ncbi:MAG TPA: 16S rRNA (guanine(527)-N(7))-methyltransferase RsmG [Methylomirabilota bacterium]|nr:16S rRNA (guanine(527)-N(7))-methyltransferase RsmG [Methylomirabilota bacterium]